MYSIGAILFTLVTGHAPSSSNGKLVTFGKEWQQKEIVDFGLEVQ
jgi:hypothetical protein